jgi:U3 small nucleolar RNA-associated protein 20
VRFDAAIVSHDRRLRLSALRMVNAHSDVHGESATVPRAARACLLAEEVALDVAGVRDRVLKTGKVPSSVHDDGRDVLLATRWLLGLSDFGFDVYSDTHAIP